MYVDPGTLSRAQGCLLGQPAGDSLGSLVEFQSSEQIRCNYPDGVRELADGGTWGTIAGQPTDDSEMALTLARILLKQRRYSLEGGTQGICLLVEFLSIRLWWHRVNRTAGQAESRKPGEWSANADQSAGHIWMQLPP